MKATVFFPPAHLQREAWFASGAADVIKAYRENNSRRGPVVEVLTTPTMTQEAICDELFDLSNNPGRQDERDEKWGEFRSLSTGDIVEVEGGRAWICKSIGWEEIVRDPMPAHLARADSLLTAEELRQKYGNDRAGGEHPKYFKRDWMAEVAFGDTLRGYWDWVEAQIEAED